MTSITAINILALLLLVTSAFILGGVRSRRECRRWESVWRAYSRNGWIKKGKDHE